MRHIVRVGKALYNNYTAIIAEIKHRIETGNLTKDP
jgi:hypothetical protein